MKNPLYQDINRYQSGETQSFPPPCGGGKDKHKTNKHTPPPGGVEKGKIMKIKNEAMTEQLKFFMGAAVGHLGRYDLACGDAQKGEGKYFQRAGLVGLSVADIHTRARWLRAVNAAGGGVADHPLSIYISPHVHGEAQHLLMVDDLDLSTCQQIGEGRLHLIVETSKNNHQLWLPTSRPVGKEERYQCQSALVSMFGGDPGSVSGDHLGRLAGFMNTKHKNAYWVNLVGGNVDYEGGGRRCNVDSLITYFQSSCFCLSPPPPGGACVSSSAQPCVSPSPCKGREGGVSDAGRDESSREFGWAVGWLKNKKDEAEGIRKLAERALGRGKHLTAVACEKYARRTFDRAKAVA